MMHCTQCGADNPDGNRFCLQCGSLLERTCANCSAVVPSGMRFCLQCGSPVAETTPQPAAPRLPQPEQSSAPAAMPQPIQQAPTPPPVAPTPAWPAPATPSYAPAPTSAVRYANVPLRFLAQLIDSALILGPLWYVLRPIIAEIRNGTASRMDMVVVGGLALVFLLLYHTLCEALGATLGKLILGLRVRNVDGLRPGLARALLRNVGWIVDLVAVGGIVGLIMVLANTQRRRIGDHIGGTWVAHRR